MEQRPLRLGDVVDDYCPRERRVTNHAIVAIVEDVIRQTRCSACDAEHPYRGGREPRLRKKPAAGELYDQVLADVAGPPSSAAPPAEANGAPGERAPDAPEAAAASAADNGDAGDREPTADERADAWLAHRQLIRATLPRTSDDPPPARPIPEFTMHQRQSRGGRFRPFGGSDNGNGNGNVNGNGPRQGRHGRPGRRRHKRPR